MRRLPRLLIIGLACGASLAALIGGTLAWLEYPGGMRAGYRATDHDPRLTAIATEARPMIVAIEAYVAAHGACPRPDDSEALAEWRAALPAAMQARQVGRYVQLTMPGALPGWLYAVSGRDPRACGLSRKLGWDPKLVWERDDTSARWTFVPGDGSDEIALVLDP